MSYRLIDANMLNNKISTEDYEIIMKEPEVFADLPNGLDGGFYIAVPATEGMTNGDMLKAMFPDLQVVDVGFHRLVVIFGDYRNIMYRNSYDEDWWNAPYKGSED